MSRADYGIGAPGVVRALGAAAGAALLAAIFRPSSMSAGWTDVARSPRTWRLFPPARYVTGTKPA